MLAPLERARSNAPGGLGPFELWSCAASTGIELIAARLVYGLVQGEGTKMRVVLQVPKELQGGMKADESRRRQSVCNVTQRLRPVDIATLIVTDSKPKPQQRVYNVTDF
jgi:hypothetical protein